MCSNQHYLRIDFEVNRWNKKPFHRQSNEVHGAKTLSTETAVVEVFVVGQSVFLCLLSFIALLLSPSSTLNQKENKTLTTSERIEPIKNRDIVGSVDAAHSLLVLITLARAWSHRRKERVRYPGPGDSGDPWWNDPLRVGHPKGSKTITTKTGSMVREGAHGNSPQ